MRAPLNDAIFTTPAWPATAPETFGAVHGNRSHDQPCRCGRHHDEHDPWLGTAVNPASYRYTEQVIWNHHASALWKQTVGVGFIMVAEFQRRGVVHYHAIIRVDGVQGVATAPPGRCTTALS